MLLCENPAVYCKKKKKLYETLQTHTVGKKRRYFIVKADGAYSCHHALISQNFA